MQPRSSHPTRSSSRSAKRSTTNLADLRLSPLTARYQEPINVSTEEAPVKSPYDEARDFAFARNHSSYIQGRSAPTSPGILSRSSSRKALGAGLSRRTSLYDEAEETIKYHYGGGAMARPTDATTESAQAEGASGRMPKAKSEAALLSHQQQQQRQQRLSGRGVPVRKPPQPTTTHSKPSTANLRPKRFSTADEEDWLVRTHAATHALVQEAKGQSWLASHTSSTTLTQLDHPSASRYDDDDLDEGYEELAALSAQHRTHNRNARFTIQPASAGISPSASRAPKSPGWGSRYGSRANSRRTSRRPSPTGSLRTPMTALDSAGAGGGDYFGPDAGVAERVVIEEGEEIDDGDDNGEAEAEVARLARERGYGLSGFVDRLLFGSSGGHDGVTDDEAVEEKDGTEKVKRRTKKDESRDETARLDAETGDAREGGAWQDAAWLMNVAAKALF